MRPEGGHIAAIVSTIALLLSAYSLWETSLKQADLNVYVTGTVSYGRDLSEDKSVRPPGGFEVFAVPITIANGGARDAAVLAMHIVATNPETGRTTRFSGAYTAEGTYFAKTRGAERPKTPFSALVISGRSAWTGTVLFYSLHEGDPDYADGRDFREDTVVRSKLKDKVDLTLELVTPPPSGWLDRALTASVPPIKLSLDVPYINLNALSSGDLVRLRWAGARP